MVQTQINIKRGEEITPINFIDSGQIGQIHSLGDTFHEFNMLEVIFDMKLNGLFIDVGAHVGNHSIFFAKYCNADVVCFEPDPQTYLVLRDNIKANRLTSYINPINAAVGSKKGFCNLHHNEERPGQSRITMDGDNCNMTTLNHIKQKVGLIKIDVEVNELDAIKGCMKIIERDLPELFIETFGDFNKILKVLPKEYLMKERYNAAPTFHFSIK